MGLSWRYSPLKLDGERTWRKWIAPKAMCAAGATTPPAEIAIAYDVLAHDAAKAFKIFLAKYSQLTTTRSLAPASRRQGINHQPRFEFERTNERNSSRVCLL